MRKHSPRKWLHFILDLLPVIMIPVFMIYSHRHTIDSYSVTVDSTETTTTVNYKYETNEVNNNASNLVIDNVYHFTVNNNTLNYGLTFTDNDEGRILLKLLNVTHYDFENFSLNLDDIGLFGAYSNQPSVMLEIYSSSSAFSVWIDDFSNGTYLSYLGLGDLNFDTFSFECDFQLMDFDYVSLSNNIITSSTYNEIESVTTETTGTTVTYNDTDIMSQLTYNMYNVVTKYFNFNNVATFGAMYDWLVANMFNGSAPLIAPIIWNIILYEFIIDLIFLIYSAFMFFIDFAEKCLDAFFNKSFGGGR